MIIKVRTNTRVSLNLTPKEASTLVQVLAAASSPESGLRHKIETLYSELYKSLEDQGFEPMLGRLNLRCPVRQKPAPEDPPGEFVTPAPEAPPAAPPAAPWPPVVGQEVETRPWGPAAEGWERTKVHSYTSGSGRAIYVVHVRDPYGDQKSVTRDLDQIRPIALAGVHEDV